MLIVAGGLIVAANLALVAGFAQRNEGNAPNLPVSIEALIPEPGTVMRPQEPVGADLRDDLQGVLTIDRLRIPEDQYRGDPGLGLVAFRPGPGQEFTQLEPGAHSATITYWPRTKTFREARRAGEVGGYTWEFKVG